MAGVTDAESFMKTMTDDMNQTQTSLDEASIAMANEVKDKISGAMATVGRGVITSVEGDSVHIKGAGATAVRAIAKKVLEYSKEKFPERIAGLSEDD